MEYYIFATEAGATACLDYINATPWFPIVGQSQGVPAPQNQTTTKWVEAPSEMLTGEWAVPRIPNARLDHLEVPQGSRDAFMSAFGQDIRGLDSGDFPSTGEE